MTPEQNTKENECEYDSGCWETPSEIFDQLHTEFGFEIDVCALPFNTKVPMFLSPDNNALKQKWTGVCWMNPPYGRGIEQWVKKAWDSSNDGATVVCLLPARTETEWWHEYCMRGEIRFLRGRIWFKRPNGKTGRPRFGSAIVVFRQLKKDSEQ